MLVHVAIVSAHIQQSVSYIQHVAQSFSARLEKKESDTGGKNITGSCSASDRNTPILNKLSI